MYNYEEEQYKEILKRGIYNMANPQLADEYVKELRSRGHDIHVIHAVGECGIRDIIFKREKSNMVYEMLLSRQMEFIDMLEKLESAISIVSKLIG